MFEDESDKFAESGKAKEDVDVPDEDVTNEDVQDNAEPDECVTDSGNCVMVAGEFRRKLIENVMKFLGEEPESDVKDEDVPEEASVEKQEIAPEISLTEETNKLEDGGEVKADVPVKVKAKRKKSTDKNVHEGHRMRLRKILLNLDCKNWNEHEVLEFLLYYGCPRKDMNETAHKLIMRFGSLKNVLEADVFDLMNIGKISKASAEYLAVLRKCMNYCASIKNEKGKVRIYEELCAHLSNRFKGEFNEIVYITFLTVTGQSLFEYEIKGNSPTAATVSFRDIAENCLRYHAASVLVAHAHPSGFSDPSVEDDIFTQNLSVFLENMGVALFDHLIWADGSIYSYSISGRLKCLTGK